MRAKGYVFAIEWIAYNDEPGDEDPEAISGYISTGLVADLFDKPRSIVTLDILSIRQGNIPRRLARGMRQRKDR